MPQEPESEPSRAPQSLSLHGVGLAPGEARLLELYARVASRDAAVRVLWRVVEGLPADVVLQSAEVAGATTGAKAVVRVGGSATVGRGALRLPRPFDFDDLSGLLGPLGEQLLDEGASGEPSFEDTARDAADVTPVFESTRTMPMNLGAAAQGTASSTAAAPPSAAEAARARIEKLERELERRRQAAIERQLRESEREGLAEAEQAAPSAPVVKAEERRAGRKDDRSPQSPGAAAGLQAEAHPHESYRLKRWPPGELLALQPNYRRLAAFLGAHFLSTESLSRASGVDLPVCYAFIELLRSRAMLEVRSPDGAGAATKGAQQRQAASAERAAVPAQAGKGVVVQMSSATSPPAPERAAATGGFIQRLRRRFGLG